MEILAEYFEEVEGFPRPKWEGIFQFIEENYKETEEFHQIWCDIARYWMTRISSGLGKEYTINETENFILLSSEETKYVDNISNFLERVLKRILNTLPGIVSDEGYGKHVVIIFDDIDTYYSYLSYYYSEDGVYALSSGVYLNNGYGHFVFPYQDVAYAEPIISHEMTHALLSHLPLPVWLDEGLAVGIENLISGYMSSSMDRMMYIRHQNFWKDNDIQNFWSGDIFRDAGEGNELGYSLAQFTVNSLSKDYNAFRLFVSKASYSDSGEAAAKEVYGVGLGELLSEYFGEGDWSPRPEAWKKPQPDTPIASGYSKLRFLRIMGLL